MPALWLTDWHFCPHRFQARFWIFSISIKTFGATAVWLQEYDWVCMCPFTCAPRQPIYMLEWSGLGQHGVTRCWGKGPWCIRKACVNHKLILRAQTLVPDPLLVTFNISIQKHTFSETHSKIALLKLVSWKSNAIVQVQHLCKAVLATQSAVVHAHLKIYNICMDSLSMTQHLISVGSFPSCSYFQFISCCVYSI